MSTRAHKLEREQIVRAPIDDVFEFFSVARNLERITPSILKFETLTPEPIEMHVGTLIDYKLRVHGIPMRWQSRIDEWDPGRMFVDRQLHGPYALWHHRHTFAPGPEPGTTLVRDFVHYRLPFGILGVPGLPLVKRDLGTIFAYRHKVVDELAASGRLTS